MGQSRGTSPATAVYFVALLARFFDVAEEALAAALSGVCLEATWAGARPAKEAASGAFRAFFGLRRAGEIAAMIESFGMPPV